MVFEYFERDLARYMQEAGSLSESRALAISKSSYHNKDETKTKEFPP